MESHLLLGVEEYAAATAAVADHADRPLAEVLGRMLGSNDPRERLEAARFLAMNAKWNAPSDLVHRYV